MLGLNINNTNYQYWWDKIWTVLTIYSGGIKYELYKLSILSDKIWTFLTINNGGIKYED